MKIIYISTHANDRSTSLDLGKNKQLSFEQGHFGSWQSRFAERMKTVFPKLAIECWRPYNLRYYGEKGFSKRKRNGISYYQLPSIGLSSTLSLNIGIIRKLFEIKSKKEKIIIHLQGLHNFQSYLISYLFSDIPIICQHRPPGLPPLLKIRKKSNIILSLFNYVMGKIDVLCIKNYDFIFLPSFGEINFMKKYSSYKNHMRLKGGGFSFDKYPVFDRLEIRRELGIPLNSKVILHIGRFNKLKGLDFLAKIYYENFNKDKNILCYAIGGQKNQELYKDLIGKGIKVIERLPKSEVLKYINAADVLVHPSRDKTWLTYGDCCNVIIEALSLNCPVIGPQLKNFDSRDRKNLGFMTNDEQEIIKSLNIIFRKNPFDGNTMRNIIKNYYSWERILKINYLKYRKSYDKAYIR